MMLYVYHQIPIKNEAFDSVHSSLLSPEGTMHSAPYRLKDCIKKVSNMNSKLISLVLVAAFCATNLMAAFAAPQSGDESIMTPNSPANNAFTFEQYFADVGHPNVKVSSNSVTPTRVRVNVALTKDKDTIKCYFDFNKKVVVPAFSSALIYKKVGTTYRLKLSEPHTQVGHFRDITFSINEGNVEGGSEERIYKVRGNVSFKYKDLDFTYTKAFVQRFVLRE
eukprot:Nk52_evm64s226 gene=Nk52_evmTU64s226